MVFFSFLNKYRDGLRTIPAPLHFTQYINRPPNSRPFLKISKEIGKAWRKSLTRAKCASLTRPQGVFSALFQTFCLTARTYLNMQKYGLFCSLLLKLHRNHKGASLNSLKISEMSLTILLFLTISSSLHVLCRRADLVKKKHFSRYILILFACALLKALQSDDKLLCDIEISGKTQNHRLKSVWNFKVTRFYLILPCKQNNWTSGTYSIEIIINMLEQPGRNFRLRAKTLYEFFMNMQNKL